MKVGKFKKEATAYPLDVITDYLNYLANERQDKQAQALLLAVTQADLERTIKEANGIQVTAMQHEARREETRVELLAKLIGKWEQTEKDLEGIRDVKEYNRLGNELYETMVEASKVWLQLNKRERVEQVETYSQGHYIPVRRCNEGVVWIDRSQPQFPLKVTI